MSFVESLTHIHSLTRTFIGPEPYFDCGCAILSRQFDRDRDRVVSRAKTEGVSGIIGWFSDIEKQSGLSDLCKSNLGHVYCIIGIHPDNIDRTNKKSHEGRFYSLNYSLSRL